MIEIPFKAFSKIPRLSREIVVTEKIDGTNACVSIVSLGKDDLPPQVLDYWYAADGSCWGMLAGSRNRWLTLEDDNYGFAKWVKEHVEELKELGPGTHYGEWWGQGIQRNYGLREKRFSLFNVHKWGEKRPACCGVVPTLYRGMFSETRILDCLSTLLVEGSKAQLGYMNPEGIVVFHTAGGHLYKKTIDGDEAPKGVAI